MNSAVLDEPKITFIDYNEYRQNEENKRKPSELEDPSSQYLLENVQFQFLGSRGCLENNRKHSQDEVTLTDISGVLEKGINYGHAFTLREVLEDINSKRMVFFGE